MGDADAPVTVVVQGSVSHLYDTMCFCYDAMSWQQYSYAQTQKTPPRTLNLDEVSSANPKPQTPTPQTLNPNPKALNPKTEALNPKPKTPKP